MVINFPKKGIHDNKPTPKIVYDIIINQLKFIDVCLDKTKFDATTEIWQNHSY
jgi:hypothetical protein